MRRENSVVSYLTSAAPQESCAQFERDTAIERSRTGYGRCTGVRGSSPTGRPPPPARSGSTPRPATARRQRQPLLFLVDHARRHATPCFRSPRYAPPGEPGPSLPVSVVDGAPRRLYYRLECAWYHQSVYDRPCDPQPADRHRSLRRAGRRLRTPIGRLLDWAGRDAIASRLRDNQTWALRVTLAETAALRAVTSLVAPGVPAGLRVEAVAEPSPSDGWAGGNWST